jgi:hypothetical protein
MASNARRRAHPRRVVSKEERIHDGVVYRSGFEAGVARDLSSRGLSDRVEYEAETLWYSVPKFSRVDFKIRTDSGREILVEAKGYFPPEDRTKVLRVVECNPDVDYRLLFQRNDPSNVSWARKHRIKYAIGTIPDAWFQE